MKQKGKKKTADLWLDFLAENSCVFFYKYDALLFILANLINVRVLRAFSCEDLINLISTGPRKRQFMSHKK